MGTHRAAHLARQPLEHVVQKGVTNDRGVAKGLLAAVAEVVVQEAIRNALSSVQTIMFAEFSKIAVKRAACSRTMRSASFCSGDLVAHAKNLFHRSVRIEHRAQKDLIAHEPSPGIMQFGFEAQGPTSERFGIFRFPKGMVLGACELFTRLIGRVVHLWSRSVQASIMSA